MRPGPQIGDLGRTLIADSQLGHRLATIECPFGDGLASARIAERARQYLKSPATRTDRPPAGDGPPHRVAS